MGLVDQSPEGCVGLGVVVQDRREYLDGVDFEVGVVGRAWLFILTALSFTLFVSKYWRAGSEAWAKGSILTSCLCTRCCCWLLKLEEEWWEGNTRYMQSSLKGMESETRSVDDCWFKIQSDLTSHLSARLQLSTSPWDFNPIRQGHS